MWTGPSVASSPAWASLSPGSPSSFNPYAFQDPGENLPGYPTGEVFTPSQSGFEYGAFPSPDSRAPMDFVPEPFVPQGNYLPRPGFALPQANFVQQGVVASQPGGAQPSGGPSLLEQMATQVDAASVAQQKTSNIEDPISAAGGQLIVGDSFVDEKDEKAHGSYVDAAAQSVGFTGPIDRRTELVGLAQGDTFRWTGDALKGDSTPPELAAMAFKQQVIANQVGLLKRATDVLQDTLASGANHSAVNFSQGAGASRIYQNMMGDLYKLLDPRSSPEQVKQSKNLYNNLVAAFGLKGEATPEQFQQVKQAMIDNISSALKDNPQVAAAQTSYAQAVQSLAERKVTVVVAAGNEGTVLHDTDDTEENKPLQAPPEFYDNPLSVPGVVTVGATAKGEDGSESVADYSSPERHASIWADGVVAPGVDGTSFAAPRIAAVTAALHGEMPDASNEQVEQYLSDHLTHRLSTGQAALNAGNTASLLQHSDFNIR